MADANESRQLRQQIVEIILPFVTTTQNRVDLVSASWSEQAKQQYEINYEGAGRQFTERFISESLLIGRQPMSVGKVSGKALRRRSQVLTELNLSLNEPCSESLSPILTSFIIPKQSEFANKSSVRSCTKSVHNS